MFNLSKIIKNIILQYGLLNIIQIITKKNKIYVNCYEYKMKPHKNNLHLLSPLVLNILHIFGKYLKSNAKTTLENLLRF